MNSQQFVDITQTIQNAMATDKIEYFIQPIWAHRGALIEQTDIYSVLFDSIVK